MKKKVLAILAAVMVLSFGTTAFAANSPVAGNVTENVKENAEQKAEVSSDVKTSTPEKYAEAVAGATATVNGTAVTITAQPNNANLCNLIPGLLIFNIVVMKFIAPNKLLTPDKCKPNIAKSTLGPL